MIQRFTRLMVGLTAVTTVACAPPAPDTAADVAAVEQVNSMEAAYINSADIDGSLSILTTDVVAMPPNEPMFTGLDGMRQWLAAFHEMFAADLAYTESEVVVSGDWAVQRYVGTMTMTPKAGGDPVVENLKGVHFFQRQDDGSWKITIDIWNTDTPLPGM
jgi:ketosteroid isomerase-like protein